ncbi:MAG TPA: sulfocyanin-like copper-binding protein [Dehalococcoidia bacterium]|nr:sulfocyanin-like copper-binding protein [Dehalococcoidia bacterium]
MRNISFPAKWMIAAAATAAAGLLLLSACGGGGDDSGKAAEDQSKSDTSGELIVDPAAPTVNVALKEWGVTPAAVKSEAGSVTFNVANTGTKEHEFVIIKTDTPADKLVNSGAEVDEEAAGDSPGEIEGIQAGQTVSKTFDLAPGQYVFICNIEGHYVSGMHTDFNVE